MSGFQDQEFKSNLICAMAIAGICCGIAGGIVTTAIKLRKSDELYYKIR